MTVALALLMAQAMPGMTMPEPHRQTPAPAPGSSPARVGAPSLPQREGGQHNVPKRTATEPRPSPGRNDAPITGTSDEAMSGMATWAATRHGYARAMAMRMGMGDGAYEQGSGTTRLPAAEGEMRGRMIRAGGWMLMAHGYVWGVATHQAGLRGDDEAFATSMAMLMADRDLGERLHLQLKSMTSLDPLMGPRGYPDLFASGETAHGRPLIDRQHPHDLFMELAGRVDYRLGAASLFLYGGPVAEPALGPSAFMHRGSARYLPLAPITHHWFDSTHISYGVVTAGYAGPRVQLEASAFRGREPDEHRWNIETPKLDSWSVRATWTPSAHLAAQVSHGRLQSPEAQHPDENERRTTASVHYAAGGLTTTLAFSAKHRIGGATRTAWLGEASWEVDRHHALFGRVENVANDELFSDPADPRHDRAFRVTKAEGGYAYRLRISGPLGVALGGTVAAYAKPAALASAYGTGPVSWTLFSKVVLGL